MEEDILHEEISKSPVPSDGESIHSGSGNSDTSTLRYDQESFVLFRPRIERLFQILWPPRNSLRQSLANSRVATWIRAKRLLGLLVPTQELPLIERLQGGEYNRIVGIKLPPASSDSIRCRDLILRVPRWGQGQTERVVATLNYLRQKSSIPVAEIVAKDYSKDNPLESTYIIQERIPGSNLETLWNDLNHSQRCSVARDVGRVMKALLALESPVTGYIEKFDEAFDKNKGPAKPHIVVPFDLKSADGDLFEESEQPSTFVRETPRVHQTTLEFFKHQIGRWRAIDVERNAPMVDRTIALWDAMLKIVEEMNDLDSFTTKLHCLCHLDLYPRNIMVNLQPTGSAQVTGILDWDDAVFAPKFVACEPPGWLWGFDFDDLPRDGLPTWPYERPGANDLPPTPEKQELKRVFEEHAGMEYLTLAYEERWRIGRSLFRIAGFGLTSSENYDAAERIISDWATLRQPLTL